MPPLPREIKPHPHGVDVETLNRLIRVTKCRNMVDFMKTHFHRVSEGAALNFLRSVGFIKTKDPKKLKPEEIASLASSIAKFRAFKNKNVAAFDASIKSTRCKNLLDFLKNIIKDVDEMVFLRFLWSAGLARTKDPRKLKPQEIVKLMRAMKKFVDFRPPDAGCLSPLGEELLETGILKELNPEFVAVVQRKPDTYSGHPFIVETAIAYGGDIPSKNDILLYRFANRIPLLYDEASDVSWTIIKSLNWRRYRVSSDMPIALLVHICSTKIPYKTVGKEFIADRPEVKSEVLNGIRDVARQLQRFLAKREHVERAKQRFATFSKYLPIIARFSTELAGKEEFPDIEKLLRSVRKFEEA
jgi:DNA topoisomerase-6 subunit B